MPKISDWEGQIGHRLRLRDLHVFSKVVQFGSMAKAAVQLRVTQPAISQVIADLEHVLGVSLLDRSPQGVKPTIYGDALMRGGVSPASKTALRGVERAIEIGGIGERKLGERLAGRRIDHDMGTSTAARDRLAVDHHVKFGIGHSIARSLYQPYHVARRLPETNPG